ncbi:hypothetical protein [Arthrobacter sp. S39]|uniref:hypothetical protein n=1 Tax=Arthrobacter sp. S39 TaxID=2509720 RepID=UPI0010377FC9|nr:hypothetical protein [Arthrobacter sp. S39]TAP45816.1 hypothetical protein EYS21_03700 [Arthrobacter sp. S39]
MEHIIADSVIGKLPSKLFTPCRATMLILQKRPAVIFRFDVSVRLYVGGGAGRIFSSDTLAGQWRKRGDSGRGVVARFREVQTDESISRPG